MEYCIKGYCYRCGRYRGLVVYGQQFDEDFIIDGARCTACGTERDKASLTQSVSILTIQNMIYRPDCTYVFAKEENDD